MVKRMEKSEVESQEPMEFCSITSCMEKSN
jgi:hypothetical protein